MSSEKVQGFRERRGQTNPARLTPLWFGQTVPVPAKEEKVVASNYVPKLDLLVTQLLEITNDYGASQVFLDRLCFRNVVSPLRAEDIYKCSEANEG